MSTRTVLTIAAVVAGLWWDVLQRKKKKPPAGNINDPLSKEGAKDAMGGTIGIVVESTDTDQPSASGEWSWHE